MDTMKLRLLLLTFLFPLLASAQASPYHRFGQVLSRGSGVSVGVVPYANIDVCVAGSSPCTAASIYYNVGLTSPITGPVVADGSGNFTYYLAGNQCVDEYYSAPGITAFKIPNVCSSFVNNNVGSSTNGQILINSSGAVAGIEQSTFVSTVDTSPQTLSGTLTAPTFIGSLTGSVTGSVTGAASLNVLKSGDTMTGPLVLPGNPTTNLQAATKQYVDTAAGAYVPIAGGTMTGALALPPGVPSSNNPVTAAQLAAGTLPASLTSLCNATGPQDVRACYGAKGDVRYLTGTISSGSPVLTITAGTGLITDVGKVAVVYGCGSSSGENLYTTVTGFTSSTSETLATSCLFTGATNVQVEIGTDDTAAGNACIAASYAGTGTNKSTCEFTPGSYFVTMLDISSDNEHPFSIQSDNAVLIGIQASPMVPAVSGIAMVYFYGAAGTNVYGHLTLDGNYDMNYGACDWVESPFVVQFNVDRKHCNIATHIGVYNGSADSGYPLALGLAEGYFIGGNTLENNLIWDVVGSNTVYSVTGAVSLIGPGGNTEFGSGFCTFHAAWCAVTTRPTIRAIGGELYVAGGEVLNEYDGSPAVDVEPIDDNGVSGYIGTHGVVSITNAHTEVLQLFTVTNPAAYTTTDTNLAFQCVGCGGFFGLNQTLGTIDSTSYAKVRVAQSHFYANFSITVPTIINNSSNANVDIDDSFLQTAGGLGFKQGLTGISGPNIHVLNDQTLYTSAGTVLPACAANFLLDAANVGDASALTPGTAYTPTAGAGTNRTSVRCTYTGSAYAWQTQ